MKKISTILLTTLVFGLLIYVVVKFDIVQNQKIIEISTKDKNSSSSLIRNDSLSNIKGVKFQNPNIKGLSWKMYENTKAGFRVMIPVELLKKDFSHNTGDTGEIYWASIKFPSGFSVIINSLTTNYTAPKDWNWGYAHGYLKKDNQYYMVGGGEKLIEVNPKEFWIVNNFDKAIVLRASDVIMEPNSETYPPDLLIIANNPNIIFPAVGFQGYGDFESPIEGLNLSSEDEEYIIKKMVNSLEFIK